MNSIKLKWISKNEKKSKYREVPGPVINYGWYYFNHFFRVNFGRTQCKYDSVVCTYTCMHLLMAIAMHSVHCIMTFSSALNLFMNENGEEWNENRQVKISM